MNKDIKAGADIHAGDGGYSIGTQEEYDKFAKGRNQSLGKTRIKELALECYNPYSNFDHEKFAELIVLKCAEIADTAEPFLASDLIKEHFGVKE